MGVIDLDIFVQDPAAALASFDVIQVERSITDELGPFYALTAPAPAKAATLLSGLLSPYVVGGTTLQLMVDSAPAVDIVFPGIGSLTVDQVALAINGVVSPAVAADDLGRLRLTSTLLGTASKLEIIGGSAVTPLGFTVGQRDIGEEPYIPLVSGQTDYTFSDKDGEAGYFYRVRFYNTATGLFSEWSAPFQGAPGTLISAAGL